MGKVARHPLTILLYVLIAPILVSLISAKVIDRDKDLKNMAPIEYVDKANAKQDAVCEKAISNIEDKKADKTELEALRENQTEFKKKFETMDDRIYDLWKLQFDDDD